MDFDEVKNLEMTEQEVEMARELQQFIQSDDINEARTFIEKLSPETRQRITRSNPNPVLQSAIIVAIEKGNIEFVQFLVNECRANFAEKVLADDAICYGYYMTTCGGSKCMSPLEIAIRRNEPDIVSYLLSIGADVDNVDNDGKMLHLACKTYSLKTVQILVDHGADVNASDERGYTCLMYVVKNLDLCRFLLDKGADINKINKDGETAIHVAAKSRLLSTVKLLVERGADATRKYKDGRDLLQLASWHGDEITVDFLKTTIFKDVNRHIEAFQLLGARFALDDCLEKALSAWREAIQLSSESGIVLLAATVPTPFGIAVEATTLAELDAISQNSDQLYTQCIVMIYKYFGPEHPTFFRVINIVMLTYLRIRSYGRWLQIVIYCFEIMQNPNLNLIRVFSELHLAHLSVGACVEKIHRLIARPSLDFVLVYEFTRKVVEKTTKCTQTSVHALRLIDMLINAILMFAFVESDNCQNKIFFELVRSGLKTGLKCSKGKTLLIRALELCERHHFRESSPHLGVITMLLECGADVNDRDEDGNNVLHLLIRSYETLRFPIVKAKTLAVAFVNNGIHLDARNKQGLETTSVLKKLGLNVMSPINLMCSAARAIRRFNIDVDGVLPKFLVEFAKIH